MKLRSLKVTTVKLLLLVALAINAFSLPENVDTTFNPILIRTLTDSYTGAGVMQPDGKWIVWGTYSPNGRYMQRLNPDGTVDHTFDCVACRGFVVTVAAVQSDGKILVGGTTLLIRVHSNGRLDPSFKAPFTGGLANCNPKALFPLADSKSLVLCDELGVRRLDSNGNLDATFTPITLGTNPRLFVAQMVVLPDGKILIGGRTSDGDGWLRRHNADGTLDSTFTANPNDDVKGVGLLADGKYLVTGSFSSINGISKSKIARLNIDGSVDPSFTAGVAIDDFPEDVRTLSNGQFYVRMRHSFFPTPNPDTFRSVRYNADGSVDNTFAQTFFNSTFFWAVDAQHRIFTFRSGSPSTRFYRLSIDGSVDPTFVPVIKVHAKLSAAALQTDGKILVAGQFLEANGAAVIRFTRLNPDGTNDATFNSGTGFDIPPDDLAVQPDGKILAAGSFTGYNFLAQPKLVRINPDGSADATFTPVISGGNVLAIAPLANGKILIGGSFTGVNGVGQKALARLNADGSRDTSFNPVFGNSNPTIYELLVQTDGKFLAGGSFSGVDGHSTSGVVRFNSNDTVDTGFVANTSDVNNIELRSDGKYVVSEWNVGGNDPSQLYRLNNNGSRDFSFPARGTGLGGYIYTLLVQQPSGNILYGGIFPKNINRLGPSGEQDVFFPSYGANDTVNTIFAQPDGKVIVAGLFSGIEDVGRHGIARLILSNRIRGTMFDYDGDGRTDVSVFRPSTNTWYQILSATGSIGIQTFGAAGDILAPADYDGDGKTDLGLYRPTGGHWLFITSSDNTVTQRQWGLAGDIPRPSDMSGDGAAELVVFRPSNGVWYFVPSTGGGGGSFNFGIPGDQPLVGDFDGDAKFDPAVFRPSTGDWWYAASSSGFQHRNVHWGATGDLPVPADYDGDAKTDYAVFRPSDGGWYIYNSIDGSFTILAFGTNGDRPAPGDYDGDGRSDLAVFRPSTGIWYLYQSTSGFAGLQFGLAGDIPTPNAFVP